MRISLRGIESEKDIFAQQKSANCIEKFTTGLKERAPTENTELYR
ncbi:MAG: hypothetical protein JWQ66_607 [Mucilaginibacter sp.]|nr:hypothetical protein [Mucilaginibacter sp.]